MPRNRGREGDSEMTDYAVRLIVANAFQEYERETGLPRHTENLNNFGQLFAIVNKISGGVKVLMWVIGLPASAVAIIAILKYVRGN